MNGHHQDFDREHNAPIWAEVLNSNLRQLYERQEAILARESDILALLKRNDIAARRVSLAEESTSNPDKETIMKYQGKSVTSRPARDGDEGFDATKGDQVVITLPDGTEKTVLKSEVSADK